MIAGSRDESAELNPRVVSQAGNDPHCAGASKPDIWVTAIQLIVVVTVQTCFFTCPCGRQGLLRGSGGTGDYKKAKEVVVARRNHNAKVVRVTALY